ncbi:MAG: site-2 protease family protein [Halobacteriaceae archaeon]
MDTLTWVLVGVGVFWLVAAVARARGLLPDAVRVQGPLVTVHTTRGRALIDWIASPRRAWRAWGNFGLGVALVVMIGSVVFLAAVAVLTVLNPPPETAVNQPRNVLVIPGVNEFLPLSVAPEIIFGLVFGVVVHEAGHGILCRVEDIDIESMGLVFITVVFSGAFVEPNEESQRRASRGGRSRMFAAGVTNNFAVTAVAFVLLFGPVVGSLSVVPGAAVATALPGSPADRAGIGQGDVITHVEGVRVDTNGDLDDVLTNVSAGRVSVRLRDGSTTTVERSVLVTGSPRGGWPFDFDPSPADPANATIVAVNGTTVDTSAAFRELLSTREVATLETAGGRTDTGPAGAFVTVSPGGPLATAGAPTADLVVTRFAGERIVTGEDLLDAIGHTSPGQEVEVGAYRQAGGRETYTVTLGSQEGDDDGFLGVVIARGVSGLTVTDLGVETYPAGRYLSVLGGTCEQCPSLDVSGPQRVLLALQLPLAGVTGGAVFPYNWAGFTGGVQGFYEVGGLLGGLLGGWTFLLANLLFWTAWINLNLGFFNCIPTFLLDGGHLFRAVTEGVVARLPVERGQRLVAAATVTVQVVMLTSLALMLFGAQLLG